MRVDLDGNPIDSSIDVIEINDTVNLTKDDHDNGVVVIDLGDYTYYLDKKDVDDLLLGFALADKYGWFDKGGPK
jgi:hypothetical protein